MIKVRSGHVPFLFSPTPVTWTCLSDQRKLYEFCGNRNWQFNTTNLKAYHHWIWSWIKSFWSVLSEPISLRASLISACHLFLILPSRHLLTNVPSKIKCMYIGFFIQNTYPVHQNRLDLNWTVFKGKQKWQSACV